MPFKLTKPLGFAIALIVFLVALEAGIPAWRRAGLQPSTAPVFYWKGAPLLTSAPPPFGNALKLYRPDRGAELTKEFPGGCKMTLFYFEWDRIDLGPFNVVGDHAAEVCNVEYGSFILLQSGGQRNYTAPNGETLRFNYTLLALPNGNPVHVYKIPWIQGFGTWVDTKPDERTSRLQLSFLRHQGAGRVLEAGIFGAASEDDAWGLFLREALEKLQWVGSTADRR
jgi:hypothetical protein